MTVMETIEDLQHLTERLRQRTEAATVAHVHRRTSQVEQLLLTNAADCDQLLLKLKGLRDRVLQLSLF
jgi:hypothetical protein